MLSYSPSTRFILDNTSNTSNQKFEKKMLMSVNLIEKHIFIILIRNDNLNPNNKPQRVVEIDVLVF